MSQSKASSGQQLPPVWAIVIPVFIELLLTFSAFFSDSFFLSRISDAVAASVGTTIPIFVVCVLITMMMAQGASNAAGQFNGAGQPKEAGRIYCAALAVNAVLGLAAALVMGLGATAIANLLGLAGDDQRYAVAFMAHEPAPQAAANLARPPPRLPWIGLQTNAPRARLRLIAFHHAGGNASFYQPWLKEFQPLAWVEFVAVQLPGRGRRLSEPPIDALPALLEALDKDLAGLLDQPHVLFGFSMGAILAFELALRRQRLGLRMPATLVLAGRGAPLPTPAAVTRAAFSRDMIIRELKRLGGTDPALLQDSPFLDIFMRTFQADFAIADAHHCAAPEPLHCPMHVWSGADDPEVSIERIFRWNGFAGGHFASHLFPGGHFFVRSAHAQVIDMLMRILDTAREIPC
jgi:surfactin synthase thioesterase subunit